MELLNSLFNFFKTGGSFAILTALTFVIVYGGYKQWWVFGWIYRKSQEDADFWRGKSLAQYDKSDTAIQLANELAKAQAALQVELARRTSR